MNPKITEWQEELDSITYSFKKEFGHLNPQQLHWKPNPHTWSIAQNIDHLIVINESYYATFKALQENTYSPPFISKISFIVNFLSKTILNAVQPDRSRKIKTIPIWEPSKSKQYEHILQQFEQHQKDLKQKIDNLSHLIGKNKVISSPANRSIVYTLEAAFDIMITHEKRHLEQAKEIASLLSSL